MYCDSIITNAGQQQEVVQKCFFLDLYIKLPSLLIGFFVHARTSAYSDDHSKGLPHSNKSEMVKNDLFLIC